VARGEADGPPPSPPTLGDILVLEISNPFWIDEYLFRVLPPWFADGKQTQMLALHARRRADEELLRLGWEARRATGWATQEADRLMAVLADLEGASAPACPGRST
jgi:hypothetical protein